jgi:hypothetical protein
MSMVDALSRNTDFDGGQNKRTMRQIIEETVMIVCMTGIQCYKYFRDGG